jgi:hypothetical protein
MLACLVNHLCVLQVGSYDDVGGDVADMARDEALTELASANVVVLVLDTAAAFKSQKVWTDGVQLPFRLCSMAAGLSVMDQTRQEKLVWLLSLLRDVLWEGSADPAS